MDIDHEAISPFDKIFTRNVPHILETIFFYLDYESYLKCMGVRNTWKKILLSDSFKKRAKKLYMPEILKDEEKLRYLSFTGNSDAVYKIISCGLVDVNSENERGMTPLLYALVGPDEVIKMLLDGGADPNKKDKHGQTPLFLACRNQVYLSIVRLLLCKGADPNTQDFRGCTPLHYAAYDGREAIVKILLYGGALPDLKNNEDETPLRIAAGRGRKYVFEIMRRFLSS